MPYPYSPHPCTLLRSLPLIIMDRTRWEMHGLGSSHPASVEAVRDVDQRLTLRISVGRGKVGFMYQGWCACRASARIFFRMKTEIRSCPACCIYGKSSMQNCLCRSCTMALESDMRHYRNSVRPRHGILRSVGANDFLQLVNRPAHQGYTYGIMWMQCCGTPSQPARKPARNPTRKPARKTSVKACATT